MSAVIRGIHVSTDRLLFCQFFQCLFGQHLCDAHLCRTAPEFQSQSLCLFHLRDGSLVWVAVGEKDDPLPLRGMVREHLDGDLESSYHIRSSSGLERVREMDDSLKGGGWRLESLWRPPEPNQTVSDESPMSLEIGKGGFHIVHLRPPI